MLKIRRFAAEIILAVLLISSISAQADTPSSSEEFSFTAEVRFGETIDEALEKLCGKDIICLDFREEYGDGDIENDPTGDIALIHSYGITSIDRIRFLFTEVNGLPAYGYFYFGEDNSMRFVQYVLDDADDPGQRDAQNDYEQIEKQLTDTYGETEWTDETGKQSGIRPSLMPQDYTDEGVTIHKEIEQYSERMVKTGQDGVLIQHVLYTNEQGDNPGFVVRYHELCYTCVQDRN